MIQFILNKLEKSDQDATLFRKKVGNTAAIIGLLTNGLLFAAKILIGLLSNSVSIMADAINNLSDTASSLLTLVGFRIAAKPADREHPYGHERFEYISGFLVSLLVTYVGFQFLHTSFDKILNPSSTLITPLVFVVLLLSIIIKIWQGKMYRSFSRRIKSETLNATAQDSLNDVFTTVTVLVSALIEFITGWQLDGYIGFLIALYILYSGIKMIKDFIDELMGSRPTTEDIVQMEERLETYPDILGFHDLLVHNYGPNKNFATVHIEVNEDLSLEAAHHIIDGIEKDFKKSLNINLVCHVDPVPVNDRQFMTNFHIVKTIIEELKLNLRMHDFRMEKNPEELAFDLVVPPKCPLTDEEIYKKIQAKLLLILGPTKLSIDFDHNYLLTKNN
ncbi:cation diffusion facilitator family transporter [Enterococcus sp. HY326]|uniref:cation diffusion facilitator family transporter n=1 Tax=Enterococcus sp. HY326 TaxID=2971265 RepID=UPI00223F9787|nr:cation diffusion facilitator family transporter [Enterococcus sp. HY326]